MASINFLSSTRAAKIALFRFFEILQNTSKSVFYYIEIKLFFTGHYIRFSQIILNIIFIYIYELQIKSNNVLR